MIRAQDSTLYALAADFAHSRGLSSHLVSTRGIMERIGGRTESLIIITGSMGAGKSSVLTEASDLLADLCISHAAVDLDALAMGHFPSPASSDCLMYRNLESVCKNYASAGVKRLLLARAMENRSELESCRAAAKSASTVVCRLIASVEAMQQRARGRETGMLQQEFVGRVAILNAILDRARIEDFSVSSESRSVTDTAREMLVKAGWISG